MAKTPANTKQGPRTAIGLLATSKRAYQDSCGIYWSTNDFILAHGSYKHSEFYFENISQTHTALIQSITINLTIADLTPTIIRYVEHTSRLMNSGMMFTNNDRVSWGWIAGLALLSMWVDKLKWARKVFSHVDQVVVCSRITCDPRRLDREEFANKVDNIDEEPINDLLRLLASTSRQCQRIVENWVEEVGWENFKEVLAGKCEREYGNRACPLHN